MLQRSTRLQNRWYGAGSNTERISAFTKTANNSHKSSLEVPVPSRFFLYRFIDATASSNSEWMYVGDPRLQKLPSISNFANEDFPDDASKQ